MSQAKAYNRLLELALVLTAAGTVGVRTDDLRDRLGYDSTESGKRTLIRDLDDLRASGLEIDNTADPGEEARYVIRPGDVRLRVEFTPAQRTALQSALAAASAQGDPFHALTVLVIAPGALAYAAPFFGPSALEHIHDDLTGDAVRLHHAPDDELHRAA